ncbi:MAG TPA: NUDIX domain-containing protein [Casimicrobiaceae bacterium]|nr:NUDIX domain-containing protein [Casimicrobiaceae bacterium]
MRRSAGVLLFRRRGGVVEVLLVHPGGPFWRNKDAGAWTIPKGEIAPGEAPLACARRELHEETGCDVDGAFVPLPPVRQAGGKEVTAFAIEGDFDCANLASNSFELEWPPRSGRFAHYPEVDRAQWFTLDDAAEKINRAQAAWLDYVATLAKK